MIHYVQIPNINDEARRILEKHLNEMFVSVNSFMIAMTRKLVPKEQIPLELKNNILIQEPSLAVSVGVRESGKMDEIICNLIVKVFDEDNFYELSIDEKYILAKVINLGIQQEESVMERLCDTENKENFEKWMKKYRIKKEEERQIVLSELQKLEEKTMAAEDYLMSKGMKFRNWVVKVIGNKSLLCYEYPFALYGLFSDVEWEQIITMQEFEEIIKK